MKNTTKPILFSTEMVQAILAGRKTQTRRVIKSRHESGLFQVCKDFEGNITSINSLDWDEANCEKDVLSKYQPDDILWVRETWKAAEENEYGIKYLYKEQVHESLRSSLKFKPSIFMPKEAARIFLKVTNVHVERLQDISEEDAIAEGIEPGEIGFKSYNSKNIFEVHALWSFQNLWQSINAKKHPWESNPWVWVYEFERTEKPQNWPQ